MDVLLTHGYFLSGDLREQQVMRPYPPLGLLYLSAFLKRAGLHVEVFDTTFSEPAQLKSYLERSRPPLVGIYGNLLTRRQVLRIARWSRLQGAAVVLGGPEPASYAREYLMRGADVVVAGEGEQTLESLLRLRRGAGLVAERLVEIPGIHFLNRSGELISTPPRGHIQDLDSLPFPDREAIDLELYLECWRERHGEGAVSLITSRGCPYTCTWCSHGVFGYSYRSRSPGNVADEIEWIRERYQPELLWFADDVFTLNWNWLGAFARELEERDLRMPFETITREDRVNEEIAKTLGRMGCRRIWIGAESGSQRILDAMQRRTNVSRVSQVIQLLRREGIQTGLFIMLGYEGEDEETLQETLDLLKAARPDTFLTTVAYPIKGTPYYQSVEERIQAEDRWDRLTDRDLKLRGRPSDRYYRHVQRWMAYEIRLQQLAAQQEAQPLRWARARAGSWLGRLGMAWSRS